MEWAGAGKKVRGRKKNAAINQAVRRTEVCDTGAQRLKERRNHASNDGK